MEGIQMQVSKYTVKMYEADGTMRKSDTVIANSGYEAIEKVRHNPWWYEEGRGRDYHPFKWPLTFKAEVWNK